MVGDDAREETLALYQRTLAEIEASLVLWWRIEATGGRGTSAGRNLLACRCPCGRRIRAARATLDQGDITCSLCLKPFEPVDGKRPEGKPVVPRWRETMAVMEPEQSAFPSFGSPKQRHRTGTSRSHNGC